MDAAAGQRGPGRPGRCSYLTESGTGRVRSTRSGGAFTQRRGYIRAGGAPSSVTLSPRSQPKEPSASHPSPETHAMKGALLVLLGVAAAAATPAADYSNEISLEMRECE